MTDRLYYNNPYLAEFDATVDRVDERDGRTIVVLDRTAFYPTSGGQPFDIGTIGSYRVVDVFEDEAGAIAHVLDADRGPGSGDQGRLVQGLSLHGTIDWVRRFDHMQQHTGQHVLSAAFDTLFGVRTVSFHLGAMSATIDLARAVSAAEIESAEAHANQVVWEDRPVTIRYADAREAAALPLRKESAREGTLRLIEVQDFDLSACGGTHVARTGAIGAIAVASAERFKGGQRVEFLCGGRALARFRLLRDTVAAGVRLLSVASTELPAAIERLQADARDLRRTLTALHGDLMRYRAVEFAAGAESIRLGHGDAPARPTSGDAKLVAQSLAADADMLKALATAITAQPGYVAVLVSADRPLLIAVGRASDISLGADAVVKALVARFGGRGGGRAEFAQGGGLNAEPLQILSFVRDFLTSP